MADNKGDDPKGSESKPDAGRAGETRPQETRSAAVKPPVLDLKARPSSGEAADAGTKPSGNAPSGASSAAAAAGSAAPGAAARPPGVASAGSSVPPKVGDTSRPGDASKPAEPPKPADRPKPAAPAAPAAPAGFGFGAAVVGGLLGLGAAYGLAAAGYWPTPPAPTVAADPRLAEYGRAIPELETVTQTAQAELARLNQRVSALEQVPAEPAATAAPGADEAGPDLSADLAALSARIDALAQAPTPQADSGAIESLRADLAGLGDRIEELAARLGTAEAGLRGVEATVEQTSATLADQPSDIGAVLQLPLILSGLETAFATGRPYETELATLRAAVPAADVPTLIANNAASGLTRPDEIARRFEAVLPAMLAGRPANPEAGWQDGALDWFAGAIALRPTGEMEGDTPEAIISRLVGAVERRDFASARTLLESLPAPMQAAADDLPALLAQQAEGAAFLNSLRDTALRGEVTP